MAVFLDANVFQYAASMQTAGCGIVVSADRRFDPLPWLRHADPLDEAPVAGLV